MLAMVLAVLAGTAAGFALHAAVELDNAGHGRAGAVARESVQWLWLLGWAQLIGAGMWFLGGAMLAARVNAGRVILIVVSFFGVIGSATGLAVGLGSGTPVAVGSGAVGLGLATPVLSLAAARSTMRWVDAGRNRTSARYPGPAPAGPPPYGWRGPAHPSAAPGPVVPGWGAGTVHPPHPAHPQPGPGVPHGYGGNPHPR
ncbi:hypothetical protein IU436_10975 [Nocardia farcinica]|uniref:hypothetical protein n=1 Tax=Nocardia farcinica TaxID=37329 RepID=UPI001894693D|nr:hypothetical protein [Nocardia farcinica]MBF6069914.1 hypothetical protein [Nocardia farcinica]MBF6255385.1 hypothetical protein [Nocardia farcinica]MBF6268751.1 hypothetical protein [Nocardia farcinica]MBF6290855.1 hypothetical protein [Nocardia farcinica]MBF6372378.1 hypothetical protein [Nocardia farcinica]